MKQLIFTFNEEKDYNDFINSILKTLPDEVGTIEETEDIIHINIKNLKGD